MLETYTVDGLAYVLSLDDAVAEAEQLWAVIMGRALDEITGAPPRVPLSLSVGAPELALKVGSDGTFCAIARPWRRFPPLAAPSYTVQLRVEANGFLPLLRDVIIPSQQRPLTVAAGAGAHTITLPSTSGLRAGQIVLIGPAGTQAERRQVLHLGPAANDVTLAGPLEFFHPGGAPVVPDAFVPVTLGDVFLRRRPIVIRGRAVARVPGGTVPVPGASIDVTGIWRTIPAVRSLAPAAPAELVSVQPGLYADRAIGTTLAALTSFVPVTAQAKVLTAASPPGAELVDASDAVGLVANTSVIALDLADPERAERILLTNLAGGPYPTDPAILELAWPTRAPHRAGTAVVEAVPGASGPAKHLTDAGAPGDQTLFLDDVGLGATAGDAQIAAGAGAEYQRFVKLSVVSDGNGYFAFPPLHRVAQLQVEAHAAGHPPIDLASGPIEFQPDYAVPESWMDVVFQS